MSAIRLTIEELDEFEGVTKKVVYYKIEVDEYGMAIEDGRLKFSFEGKICSLEKG